MRLLRLASLFLPLALTACLSGTTDPGFATVENTTFASALAVDLPNSTKTASGLYYRDMVVGTGAPITVGQIVSVYYDAYQSDGSLFTRKLAPDTPLSLTLGAGAYIPGFEEGIVGMRVGGKRQLIIPPTLGFGYAFNDVLVFNVEAVSVQ